MFSPSTEEEATLFEKVLFQRSTSAPLMSSGFGGHHHLKGGDLSSLLSDDKDSSVLNGLLGSHTLDMPGMPPGIPNRWNPRLVEDTFTKVNHDSSVNSAATSAESVSLGEGMPQSSSTSLTSLVTTASLDPSNVNFVADSIQFGGSSLPDSGSASIASGSDISGSSPPSTSSIPANAIPISVSGGFGNSSINNSPLSTSPPVSSVYVTAASSETNHSDFHSHHRSNQNNSYNHNKDQYQHHHGNRVRRNSHSDRERNQPHYQNYHGNNHYNNNNNSIGGGPNSGGMTDVYYGSNGMNMNHYGGGRHGGNRARTRSGSSDRGVHNHGHNHMHNNFGNDPRHTQNHQQHIRHQQVHMNHLSLPHAHSQLNNFENAHRMSMDGMNVNGLHNVSLVDAQTLAGMYGMAISGHNHLNNHSGLGLNDVSMQNMQGLGLRNTHSLNSNLTANLNHNHHNHHFGQQQMVPYELAMGGLVNLAPMSVPTLNHPDATPIIHAPTGSQARSMDYSNKHRNSQESNNHYDSPSNKGKKGGRNMRDASTGNPVLDEFKRTHGRTRTWSLFDIRGNVRAFCIDQIGSRFIQENLEYAQLEDQQMLLSEIESKALVFMSDLFANYVIQKLFEFGDPIICEALGRIMEGHILDLSQDMYSCRVVQKAFEYIHPNQLVKMVKELNCPQILDCVTNQHANHCIQKAIETISGVARHATGDSKQILYNSVGFIVRALEGRVEAIARDVYGCRVIQRVIEHSPVDMKEKLLKELCMNISSLIGDQYGNYVMQHLMLYGGEKERCELLHTLEVNLLVYSKHKFASNVVETCLQNASTDERSRIIWSLINTTFNLKESFDGNDENKSSLEIMCRDPYANYVMQKIVDLADERQRATIIAYVKKNFFHLQKYNYAKHIITSLEKYDVHLTCA